jgi:hypothetical protein
MVWIMSEVLVSALLARLEEIETLANDCIAELGPNRIGDEYADGSGTAERDDFPSYPWGSGERELAFMAGPGHPDDVRRLCRAHRDIVEQCRAILAVKGWEYSDAPNLAQMVLDDLAAGLGVEDPEGKEN